MDCQDIEFSSDKSQQRIDRALTVFDATTLNRILTLGLHLLGTPRKEIAFLVDRPEESVKTSLRMLLRDGPAAFRDRRHANTQPAVSVPIKSLTVSTHREGQWQVVDFGVPGKELRILLEHKIQLRTVLLSFLNSGLLSVEQVATALKTSQAHCRELANKLARVDVDESLIDKRRGHTQDYRMGPAEKAELIQQFAARAVLKLPTSSETLVEVLNEQTATPVSARTIRWHMKKLGLQAISKTLPDLVDVQKKRLNKTP